MFNLFGVVCFANPCTKSPAARQIFSRTVDQQTNGQPKKQNELHNEHFKDDITEQEK